ncbi:MAG: T9SS type A sorting domain-containing protein [Saprospiraceae bacterium]|nr:T9SS type A sorting domain-containing protein [Saprospiraceae bacterium]
MKIANKVQVQKATATQVQGTKDGEHNPSEPSYYPQWFEKHKNEQGIIPEGLNEQWYAHDLVKPLPPEGESPILSIENLAMTTTAQGGRTRAVLVDVANPNRIFAGCVSGGLWRSNDAGASWQILNDAASTLSVTCIVQNPLKTNEIYYGTGEIRGASQGVAGAGIFKSTDGGLTFTQLAVTATNSDMRYCNYMNHSRTDANTVYVGTASGLYISTNGGATWTKILTGASNGVIPHPDGRVLATVQGATASSGIFLATTGSNFVKQTNSTFPTTNLARILIANCKAFPNVVYALFCGADYNLEGNLGVFKSSDFGANWRRMDTDSTVNRTVGTTYQAYCQFLGVHPTDSNRIVLGALRAKKSYDGGVTYQTVNYGHSDNHTFVPIDNTDNFLLGSDGGVHRLSWSGVTATQALNTGYTTFQFYAGNYAPRGKIAVGGTQDNGTWRYLTTIAKNSQGGDGGYAHVSQQDSSLAYFSFQKGVVNRTNTFVNGANLTRLTLTTPIAEGIDFINEFQMNYADGAQLYYRTAKGLWRTVDKGANWARLNTVDIQRIQAVGVTKEPNPRVYVGGNTCFFRFDSAATSTSAANVIDLRATVPDSVAAFAWGTIAVHPLVNTTLYVGMTTTSPRPRAWRVLNAHTATPKWENITGDLAASLPIYQIQPHPDKPDSLLFAATAFGLYVSSNNGKNWVKDTRIPNVPIFEMRLRPSDRTLFLFTHGRGVWYIQLRDYINGGIVTATRDVSEKMSVQIYPNPASDVLNIDSKDPLSIIQVFDLNGREIMTELNPNNLIKIKDLNSGIYFIKMFDTKGRFTTLKFIKK